MNELLLSKIYDLKEAIDNDPRIILLKEKEAIMENNDEVMLLSYYYSRAQDDYSDALKYYVEGSEELKEYQRKLFKAKEKLDSHPLVQDYLKAYQEVRLMYENIESTLITPFKSKITCKEKK